MDAEWSEAFYNGYRPNDPVERVGQFFYLRYSQWGGVYDAPNGYATSKVRSEAQSYANKIEHLEEFAARFDDVVLKNLNWSETFEKYDDEETVFPRGTAKTDWTRLRSPWRTPSSLLVAS